MNNTAELRENHMFNFEDAPELDKFNEKTAMLKKALDKAESQKDMLLFGLMGE